MRLINNDFSGSNRVEILFEQYKLYVEMADRVSQRRTSANMFFMGLHSLLLGTGASTGGISSMLIFTITAIGATLSVAWWVILNSYRQLNSGKFRVINEIEKQLPVAGYSYEWELVKEGKSKKEYWELTQVEKIVPVVFGVAYLCILVWSLRAQFL